MRANDFPALCSLPAPLGTRRLIYGTEAGAFEPWGKTLNGPGKLAHTCAYLEGKKPHVLIGSGRFVAGWVCLAIVNFCFV